MLRRYDVLVSGLVARMAGDASAIDRTTRAIRARPTFTLGDEGEAGRLPLVLEARSPDESEAELRWLEEQPAVRLVEIVFVDFAE